MTDAPIVAWFRQDLRTRDQAALAAAGKTGLPIAPIYVLDDISPGRWKMGGASRWWLHGSLRAIAADLHRLGAPLVLRRGNCASVVAAFAAEVGAGAVYCTRHVEPFWNAAEQALESRLQGADIALRSFPGTTLFDLGTIRGVNGRPLRVFSPFWRACLAAPEPTPPLPAPASLRPLQRCPASEALDDLQLTPAKPDWTGGLRDTWQPGEAHALACLTAFVDERMDRYHTDRNRPEPTATSQLSPHLHFGEVSARQVWHTVAARSAAQPQLAAGSEAYLRELGWREFYANLLTSNPEMPDEPLQRRFADFAWADDERAVRAWQRGLTGYPIVDAGMRQLWCTGWMHNRVRMIVASFLIKDLLVPWQIGEAWFWDTLVDADLGNNAGGWQWVAGCGNDPAPFFRIFNPVAQGERFDPDGAYVRRWVPELARLPDQWIHRPWEAPSLELAAAGVRLGRDYPLPIVEHARARKRALAAFSRLKGDAKSPSAKTSRRLHPV